ANLAARSLLRNPVLRRKQPLAAALPELGQYLSVESSGGANAAEVCISSAGNERSWDMQVSPLVDGGVTIGSLVRLSDVTQRRILQEELRQQAWKLTEADQRKDE